MSRYLVLFLGACTAALLLANACLAAEPLSLERIMADPEWLGRYPETPRWAIDGGRAFFERKMAGCELKELVEMELVSRAQRVVPDDELPFVEAWSGVLSDDELFQASLREGDVYLTDLAGRVTRRLTATAEIEAGLMFLAGGHDVAFRHGDRWLVVEGGLERVIADLRTQDAPDPPPEGFVPRQELSLFETLRKARRDREDERLRNLERAAADPRRAEEPWFLGKDKEIAGSWLSPSGKALLVALQDSKGEGRKNTMPKWVTDSGYVETADIRPDVGTSSRKAVKLLLLDLAARERHDIDLERLPGIKDDPLAALRQAAKEREKSERKDAARDGGANESNGGRGKDEEPGKGERGRDGKKEARPCELRHAAWDRSGSHVLVQLRARDNKDRWIAVVDAATRVLKPLHRLHDDAWISWDDDEMGWLPDGSAAWWLSEESGFMNLELRRLAEARPRVLAAGRQVVSKVAATRDGRYLYYRSNLGNAGDYEVHRVEVATACVEQATREEGSCSEFALSPDESRLLVLRSTTTHPGEIWLHDSAPGGRGLALTDSRSQAFRDIDWIAPRLIDVPSTHGAGPIHARLIEPPSPRQGRRPAVLFIHGAGYLQDAHEGWSAYFREYMFSNLLAQRGIVVLDADYRASAGYGRAWRTAIHRNMGAPELEDLRDCVTWLVRNENVEPSRVGAWGGSYGGFLVLQVMFKDPELLACGAALRSVTDWSRYNEPYTSNILETPELCPDEYRRSSPIYWASGLERELLIVAPMLDDNVLFQDSVRLVQRLIELGKENWSIAPYPVEPHTFREPASWLDEYRRILKLFERNLFAGD